MRSGTRIPWRINPGDELRVPSRQQLRQLISLANALLNGKVVRGKNGIFISDENLIFGIEDTSIGAGGSSNFPFEILTPNNGSADWLNIQVNAGSLVQMPWPDAVAGVLTINYFSENITNFNTDIAAPSGAGYVVVYLDRNTNTIIATDTDDGSWIVFGETDILHFVVGVIDTTDVAGQTVTVLYQYARSHIIWPTCGNTFGKGVMVFESVWSNLITYVEGQSTVIGEIADGFPVKGLYIFTNTGADVGPGGDWLKIADIS